ncbi:hypothetical protein [Ralstonia pseudosolanacearum]|uniref:hypothetical protein n=1 Tax=Ralstonia pseudosolanacearum TaxID=1310165 RepID=UPI002675A5CD|nr:hypothetical protein [Ralstonia pseudosolanacearum]MDO3523966.1 hypothetical protein [Ralstonia pseudosolanacearum]MDO3549460.1 hypothetical protein [Ralstonia pseudosolanacearum]MDO3553409.1 hypothetical protein [Ralstonia pseudosolanacearum]MDO3567269.1 hypothetical protein [Ralstonia pseudosolanacearum]MDO3582821.1 hypothetical protein [Ralstonia pseudosolanacearum]
MQTTLSSVISAAKPRRALFTTYTFSIFWFETFALPTLRNAGCKQIDVLVDAREACKSTEESTSLSAGSAYRIIPVYMDGTAVFHSKVVYLQGEENDHLVVSSANLTLAGHGKNLEVLDAVSSYREPAVFGEFAGFLESLTNRLEFSDENLVILREYQQRAWDMYRAAGATPEADRKAWLIHTVDQPASGQFAALASAQLEAPTSLTVLSPYHSPSGEPVARLAAAVGVQDLCIGVNARARIAPFDRGAVQFAHPPRYVAADTEDNQRFPHAKCFEVQAANGVLLMTGSVNATQQSLETTRNIEVSLARRLPETPFEWLTVEPEDFVPCDFSSVAMAPRAPSLQSTWTQAHRLVGRVKPVGEAQTVALELWSGTNLLWAEEGVQLEVDGTFNVRMGQYFDAQLGLRLEMTGPTIAARGWVNVEYELSANEQERSLTRASTRLMAGHFGIEDIHTIAGWIRGLGAPAAQPTSPAGPAARSPGQSALAETAVPPHKVTYEEWRDSVEQYRGFGLQSSVARQSFESAIKWLNRDLMDRRSPEPSKNASAPAAAGRRMRLLSEDERGTLDETTEQVGEEDATELEQGLVAAIPLALELDAHSAIVPLLVELSGCQMLKYAMECLDTATDAGRSVDGVQLVLDAWLTRFSKFDYSDINRERLLPFFCAMACCAAYYHPKASVSALKEALLRLAGHQVSAEEMVEQATMALQSNRFERVRADDRSAVTARAQAICASATLSETLETLIVRTLTNASPRLVEVPAEYAAAFGALRQHKASTRGAFGLVRTVGVGACPCCYLKLDADARRTLQATRAVVCQGCKRPIFYDLDPAELARQGLGGRFKG